VNEASRTEDAVTIERTFDAPVNVVWRMWTDPELFRRWYGPNGATIPVAEMDVRVGGKRHVCMEMQTRNGPMQMWFTGEHRTVIENELLVYTESMSDEQGNTLPPSAMGMPESHPTTTEIRVELHDDRGTTRVIMTHSGIASDSPGAAGWAMAFDKLTTQIAADRA
jgi:uncharacterized protein YndB with AHSA1/START domain